MLRRLFLALAACATPSLLPACCHPGASVGSARSTIKAITGNAIMLSFLSHFR